MDQYLGRERSAENNELCFAKTPDGMTIACMTEEPGSRQNLAFLEIVYVKSVDG